MIFRTRRPPSPRKLGRLGIALLSTVASAALGGEAYFRFVQPVEYLRPTTHHDGTFWKLIVHQRSSIPGLDYEMKPGAHRNVNDMLIETNSLGMRDSEPIADLGPNDVRIVAVGDSLTFGTKVPSEDAWPNALERILPAVDEDAGSIDDGDAHSTAGADARLTAGADVGRRFEVLNLGVSGYSTIDEALVVRHKALALSPRLVLLGYYLNDPEIEPVQQLHQHFRDPKTWEHSALLRWIAFRQRVRDQDRLGGGDVFRYLHRDPESWQSMLRHLEEIAASTSQEGVHVLFVALPTLRGFERWEDYPYADLHTQAVDAARAVGLETLDVLPAWKASGARPAELRADEEHPNAAGHALIAQAIFAKLRARPDLLENPRLASSIATRSTPRGP